MLRKKFTCYNHAGQMGWCKVLFQTFFLLLIPYLHIMSLSHLLPQSRARNRVMNYMSTLSSHRGPHFAGMKLWSSDDGGLYVASSLLQLYFITLFLIKVPWVL